jgi:thiosulfate/3-mercaptopyruvate sulfurtransferase
LNTIVDKDWLRSRIGDSNLVILDCRFSLADSHAGEVLYGISHLPGAVYCHLEKNLSGSIQEHGGRHPLPNLDTFTLFLEEVGISNNTIVVAYDNGDGPFASRLWWLMKYIGHDQVFVLNGGFREWETSKYPIDADKPKRPKGSYEINLQPERLATHEDVKAIVEGKLENTVLVDSRESKRFLGQEEPIDKIAGRIPGAINKFWNDGLENGRFKRRDEQMQRFSEISEDETVIVYCGSGVTAAPNYLILNELGFKNIKLYVGSYSDWISYGESKIEKS